MTDILEGLKKSEENFIPQNDELTDIDYKKLYEQEISKQKENLDSKLCFSFSLMTEKEEYNLNYIIGNKELKQNNDFFRRFYKALIEISNKRVRDVGQPPLNDRFQYREYVKETKKEFYKNINQELPLEAELISVKLGGPKNERMICWRKNVNDNILYVLGFQFSFNNQLYKH